METTDPRSSTENMPGPLSPEKVRRARKAMRVVSNLTRGGRSVSSGMMTYFLSSLPRPSGLIRCFPALLLDPEAHDPLDQLQG